MSKKILIVGPIPPKYGGKLFGGIATHIEGLVDNLVKKGYIITMWNYKPQKRKFYSNERICVEGNTFSSYSMIFFCIIKSLLYGKDYLNFKENILLYFKAYRLKKILKSKDFDVIHVHSLHNTTPIAIKDVLKKNVIKIIVTDHGFWQAKGFTSNTKKHLIKLKGIVECVNRIIYISDYAYQKHMDYNFNQLPKLSKISNPLSLKGLCVAKGNKLPKKTIFFNGLSESIKRKRLDLLLSAIQKNSFLRDNIKVVALVNKNGQQYINENNFDFELEVYGAISMHKVNELYAKSDLMVLPSSSESFGLVYIEALIRGIPIVAFDKVFNEFQKLMGCYIGEGFSGVDTNSSILAFKIIKALNHNIDSNMIQKRAIELFSWENKICEFEKIYCFL